MSTAAVGFYDTEAAKTLAEKKPSRSTADDAPSSNKGVHYTGVLIGCIIMLVIIVLVYVFQNQAKEYFSRGTVASEESMKKIRHLEQENASLKARFAQIAKKPSPQQPAAQPQPPTTQPPAAAPSPAATDLQKSTGQTAESIQSMLDAVLDDNSSSSAPKAVEEKHDVVLP
jgi:hypothetical protein